MKFYSIGRVAKMMNMPTSTLRYYEKEGLMPKIRKNSSGLRVFTEEDIAWLKVLECLKAVGLPLKEIKHYLLLSQQGESTLQERLQIFENQKMKLQEKIKILQQNMDKINFKIKYYNIALEKGEDAVKKDTALHTEWQQLFQNDKL